MICTQCLLGEPLPKGGHLYRVKDVKLPPRFINQDRVAEGLCDGYRPAPLALPAVPDLLERRALSRFLLLTWPGPPQGLRLLAMAKPTDEQKGSVRVSPT